MVETVYPALEKAVGYDIEHKSTDGVLGSICGHKDHERTKTYFA